MYTNIQYKHGAYKYCNTTNRFSNPVKNSDLLFNMINDYKDWKK